MRVFAQDLAKLEGLVTSVSAAALHGLDRTDTQRKVDLVLQRIESITKVLLCLHATGMLGSSPCGDSPHQHHQRAYTAPERFYCLLPCRLGNA